MNIGVPKEIKTDEYRVALTPAGVTELVLRGHRVYVQKGAGEGSGFADEAYLQSGALLLEKIEEVYAAAQMIVKVKEPIEEEYALLREDLILFTYLHLAADRRLTEVLLEKKVTAFAYETLRVERRLPLLEPMSRVAGKMAALMGAVHLRRYEGGSGRLLGGVVGVERNKVLVLGAGTAGKAAADVAAGMGADVVMCDLNTARLEYLHDVMPPNVTVRYSNKESIETLLAECDVVIGTVLVPGAKAPKLVSAQMLSLMKKGSVLVDVSIDQGGCFETSHPTTHTDPTFVVEGIVHYCVANMPGAYPRTSTLALGNATLPYVLMLAENGEAVLQQSEAMVAALNTFRGKLTNENVAQAHEMRYEEL